MKETIEWLQLENQLSLLEQSIGNFNGFRKASTVDKRKLVGAKVLQCGAHDYSVSLNSVVGHPGGVPIIKPSFSLYTDGGTKGSAVVVVENKPDGSEVDIERYLDTSTRIFIARYFAGRTRVTNNVMELRAVLSALDWIARSGCDCEVVTDSQYVLCAVYGLAKRPNRPKANHELVRDILEQCKQLGTSVQFRWVRGHSANKWNDLVDSMVSSRPTKQATRS